MSTFKSFEDIIAWQKARELSKEVYELSLTGSFSKDFSFKDQINAASGSVMDNIAEGFGRGASIQFIQFLGYSEGSLCEVKSQLYRGLDRNHISRPEFENLFEKATEISKCNVSLIRYLNETAIKGLQFKNRKSKE